jgi:hypothetical protein
MVFQWYSESGTAAEFFVDPGNTLCRPGRGAVTQIEQLASAVSETRQLIERCRAALHARQAEVRANLTLEEILSDRPDLLNLYRSLPLAWANPSARLTGDLFVPVDFEAAYMEACRRRRLV